MVCVHFPRIEHFVRFYVDKNIEIIFVSYLFQYIWLSSFTVQKVATQLFDFLQRYRIDNHILHSRTIFPHISFAWLLCFTILFEPLHFVKKESESSSEEESEESKSEESESEEEKEAKKAKAEKEEVAIAGLHFVCGFLSSSSLQ